MIKRLILFLAIVSLPFLAGLLFTYDIIKLDWVSFMEIQPSFRAQEDPLPMPARSVPVQGAEYVAGLGAPSNPVPADQVSIERGKELYSTTCFVCHGANGKGNAIISARFQYKPTDLSDPKVVNLSDGDIFVIITTGIPGRMPALRENLPTARDRWDVVNYVRQIQKGQP